MFYISANKSVASLVNNGVTIASFPASLNKAIISLAEALLMIGETVVEVIETSIKDAKGRAVAYKVVVYKTTMTFFKSKGEYTLRVDKCKQDNDGNWNMFGALSKEYYFNNGMEALQHGIVLAEKRINRL